MFMNEEKQKATVAAGCGPQFEVTDLPEPPRNFRAKKVFAILGPAVIALGGTIGGGEWLVGPSLFVKWGLALLWITTVSALLQVFLKLAMCRYPLYPGVPDKGTVISWTYVIFASCVVLVSLGRKIERTLEWANWIMMFVVLGGLLILDIYIVPGSVWLEGLA